MLPRISRRLGWAGTLVAEQAEATWAGLASAAVTELRALAGFDFVIIDQELGAGSPRDAADMLHADEVLE